MRHMLRQPATRWFIAGALACSVALPSVVILFAEEIGMMFGHLVQAGCGAGRIALLVASC